MRHGTGNAFNVGCERSVATDVVACMFTDDVHNAGTGFFRVVKVGYTVGEPGTKVEQRCRWPVGHAVVAVRRTCDHTFEETKHATQAIDLVERSDEMHFGGPGVGEAGIDTVGHQRAHQALRTVH